MKDTEIKLQLALDKPDVELALRIYDQAYDIADRAELSTLHAVVLEHAAILLQDGEHDLLIQLLKPFASTYDDLDAWRLLVSAFAVTQQWEPLLEALKRSNRLESSDERYTANLQAMVNAASKLSTEYERNNNQVASMNMYKQRYEEDPQHPRAGGPAPAAAAL